MITEINAVLFGVLLLLGVTYGLLITRNLIKIAVVLQILVKAVVIALVLAGGSQWTARSGAEFATTVLVADTIVTVVALALAVQVRKRVGTLDLAKISFPARLISPDAHCSGHWHPLVGRVNTLANASCNLVCNTPSR